MTIMDKIKAKSATGGVANLGQPAAKSMHVTADADEIFGFFADKGSITGDVVAPALSKEEWGKLY
jgi:hypothetical protein